MSRTEDPDPAPLDSDEVLGLVRALFEVSVSPFEVEDALAAEPDVSVELDAGLELLVWVVMMARP